MDPQPIYVNGGFESGEEVKVHPPQPRKRDSYANAIENDNPGMSKQFTEVDDNGNNERIEGEEAEPPIPPWDVFRTQGRAEYYEDTTFWYNMIRFSKGLAMGMCFLLIIFTGVISKLTLTLITSNLFTDYQYSCDNSCVNCTEEANIVVNASKLSMSRVWELSDYSQKKIVMWTWALILVICAPYTVTFLRNLWKTISFTKPRWFGLKVLITALISEVGHSIGVVVLTTIVLPRLDVFHSIMIFLGLGIIPSLFKMLNKETEKQWRPLVVSLNILAFLGQITVFLVYPLGMHIHNRGNSTLDPYLLGGGVSLLLMSVHWWPNYFDRNTLTCQSLADKIFQCNVSLAGGVRKFKYQRLIGSSSSPLQIVVNGIKIILTVFGVTISLSTQLGMEYGQFFSLENQTFNIPMATGGCNPVVVFPSEANNDFAPIYIALVSISSALVCYYITLHAIKSKFHAVTFALPLILLTPIALILVLSGKLAPNSFNLDSYSYMLFNLLDNDIFGKELKWQPDWIILIVAFAIWYSSQVVASFHAWRKPHKKIPSAERLFLLPMFDAECIEQSLLYNRKIVKESSKKYGEAKMDMEYADVHIKLGDQSEELEEDGQPMKRDPRITQIYFCATMWHETKKEMFLMFKSVLRMDFHHFLQRSAQQRTNRLRPNFYNFETHIFFDDAFQAHENNGEDFQVNDYVKQLVEVVPEAIKKFYTNPALNIVIKDPVKIPTPYGGRLEWTLPCGSKLIAHLKDKAKIRHKKRWSQVMYMYYFLGELLMNNKEFSNDEKITAARNTYLLALDGDVDFKPEAVLLLVDMMKKDERVGAACGRIHPIGSGPIVWYQKFEYAIAHWLQKATEHVLGCVLCSPGCFSLFRAEALMQENVMNKYATVSTKANHYLQYDQGEDRWLCTLMLQAGYKVEYNAAADAFTFAPEGFDEFFNQRRRWGPSTMANILDLIMDAQHVIRTNSNMSLLYIIYQAVQFFASIIGPGTIFLMTTGSLQIVTKWSLPACLIVNLLPNLIFIVVSFFVKSNIQLKMAKLLAIIYALVMCLVLISIIIDIKSNVCSPTAIFFFTVAGSFLFAAAMHPQEFSCVLHGVTYYVLIPCMYMLLIIYSFININNVSWGTRETAPTPTELQQAAEKAAQEKARQSGKRRSVVDILTSVWKGESNEAEVDGHRCAFGEIFHIVCCPRSASTKRNEEYWQINKKLDKLTNLVYERVPTRDENEMSGLSSSEEDSDDQREKEEEYDDFEQEPTLAPITRQPTATAKILRRKSSRAVKKPHVTIKETRNDLINPFWVEDSGTGSGDVQFIGSDETEFWENFIQKYLKPLDKSAVQQEKVEAQLMTLRVNVNFAFFLTNAMFVVSVFALQLNSDTLSVKWSCGGQKDNLDVDPFSLVFLFFFMIVLGIQVLGMIVHRLGTFWHILASTSMTPPEKDPNKFWENIVKSQVQPEMDDDDDFANDSDTVSTTSEKQYDAFTRSTDNVLRRSRRNTTKIIIEKSAALTPATASLGEALKPKLEALATDDEEQLEKQLANMKGKERRDTVRFLKTSKSSLVRNGRDRSASDLASTSRMIVNAPSTALNGARRPTYSHSTSMEA